MVSIDLACTRPTFITIGCMEEWHASRILWKAPFWLRKHMPKSSVVWASGTIKAIVVGDRQSLLRIAAGSAFWSLDRTWLDQLAKFIGCQVAKGADLFGVVFSLVCHCIPAIADCDAIDIVTQRLAMMEAKCGDDAEDLATVDEAMQVLEKRDEDIVRAAKKDAATTQEVTSAFRQAFAKKASEVRPSSGAQGAKRKRKPQRHPHPQGTISQATAKQYLPPQSVYMARLERWGVAGAFETLFKNFEELDELRRTWRFEARVGRVVAPVFKRRRLG